MLGELVLEKSALPVASIDVQLVRVESVPAGEGMATERTEVQTTQVTMWNALYHFLKLGFL